MTDISNKDIMETINEAGASAQDSSGVSPLRGEGLRGDGKLHWYIAHTYSGYENKVKESIEKMVAYRNEAYREKLLAKGEEPLKENEPIKIEKVVIPTTEVIEIKNGVKKVKTKKLFPGYVIIYMVVNNESWYLVRNTEGVTGFIGHGSNPIPLTKEEIVRMGLENLRIELDIKVGETIRIVGGSFEGKIGIVEEINTDKQVLKARMDIFGRDTLTEFAFSQVAKIQ